MILCAFKAIGDNRSASHAVTKSASPSNGENTEYRLANVWQEEGDEEAFEEAF